MSQFAERLEYALNLAGASHRSLADALGISVQAVGQAVSGQTKALTADNAARAARFLNVSHYWLATGEGDPKAIEMPVAQLEAQVLNDLREIGDLEPALLTSIYERLRAVAAGLKATDELLGGARPPDLHRSLRQK